MLISEGPADITDEDRDAAKVIAQKQLGKELETDAESSMLLELNIQPFHSDPMPFRVEVQDHALDHLIADAHAGLRLYELMMIRRPGDVWQYLWVKEVEVPPSVSACIAYKRQEKSPWGPCQWPEHSLPLNDFESFFRWDRDDTSEESVCWLTARESIEFLDYGRTLFDRVRGAQAELRRSDDLLIQVELAAMDSFQHAYDLAGKLPMERTYPDYMTPTTAKRSAAFYEKLIEVVARPEVHSVAARDDKDYQTMRILCTEQRRRAIRTGNPVGDDMSLCVVSDHFPGFENWQAKVACSQEGLGYGDLLLDCDGSGGFKCLFESYLARPFGLRACPAKSMSCYKWVRALRLRLIMAR